MHLLLKVFEAVPNLLKLLWLNWSIALKIHLVMDLYVLLPRRVLRVHRIVKAGLERGLLSRTRPWLLRPRPDILLSSFEWIINWKSHIIQVGLSNPSWLVHGVVEWHSGRQMRTGAQLSWLLVESIVLILLLRVRWIKLLPWRLNTLIYRVFTSRLPCLPRALAPLAIYYRRIWGNISSTFLWNSSL